jgi:hypothetical protein
MVAVTGSLISISADLYDIELKMTNCNLTRVWIYKVEILFGI